MSFGKFVCRKIWCRKICFGKIGVGKSVSENLVLANLLSEKSPRPQNIVDKKYCFINLFKHRIQDRYIALKT